MGVCQIVILYTSMGVCQKVVHINWILSESYTHKWEFIRKLHTEMGVCLKVAHVNGSLSESYTHKWSLSESYIQKWEFVRNLYTLHNTGIL